MSEELNLPVKIGNVGFGVDGATIEDANGEIIAECDEREIAEAMVEVMNRHSAPNSVAFALRYVKPDPVNGQRYWIGIWNDRATAESVLAAPGGGGQQEIVELVESQ